MMTWVYGGLMLFLLGALYTDLRWRKIPNKLVISLVVFGMATAAGLNGWAGVLHSLQGLGVGFGLFFIPFALGGMGGGDVKLAAAMGAVLGPAQTLYALIFATLFGGVMALVYLVVLRVRRQKAQGSEGSVFKRRFPYAGAFVLGTITVLISHPPF